MYSDPIISIPGIRLRVATSDDEIFLRALYRSTREEELEQTGWTEATKQAFADQQFMLQDRSYRSVNYEGAQFLVIEREGKAIGRLYLHEPPGELNVMDIALLPEARGHGLGTQLMEWLIDRADREGRAIVLHVEKFNRAQGLYRRLGFRRDADVGAYERLRREPAR
jgi:ribosomal protein S18 acetylase RimI-like enzyme